MRGVEKFEDLSAAKHRSEYRVSAEHEFADGFVLGEAAGGDEFDPVIRLKALKTRALPDNAPTGTPTIIHISMYCYKSFPTRIFHVLSLKDDLDSHAVFFKNNFTNEHLAVSDGELAQLVELIAKIDPAAITFSVLAPYVVETRRAVAAIRKATDAPIIIGGKYPTIVPHEALDIADYACKGEGELVMLRVHERLRQGSDLRGIQGLWYKDDDGAVVDMGQEHLYQELDDIPYPAIGEMQMHFIGNNQLSEIDTELLDDEMLVMAGRGCVYLCSFCVNSLLIPMNRGNGKFVRLRSPDNVIEELNYRLERCRKPSLIVFNDEVFGMFDDWVEEFSTKYASLIGIPFDCELVPHLIKENNVRHLAEAGMISMHFGVQSGQDEIRNKVMHRPGSNDELKMKSQMMHDLGVQPQYDFILGNPFDTADSMADALGLLLSFGTPIRLNTYKMQFFPHYPFTKMALEAGHISPADVSDEGIERATMYEWAYRPKFPAFKRRDYLENCVYLIPWISPQVRWLLASLQRKPNLALGFVATILAKLRYWQDFKGVAALVWIRRLYIGTRLVASGDFSTLRRKIGKVFSKNGFIKTKTGRMVSR
jgi:radical SAM superfamily enzyme YgiQ (UPF0313 family)